MATIDKTIENKYKNNSIIEYYVIIIDYYCKKFDFYSFYFATGIDKPEGQNYDYSTNVDLQSIFIPSRCTKMAIICSYCDIFVR